MSFWNKLFGARETRRLKIPKRNHLRLLTDSFPRLLLQRRCQPRSRNSQIPRSTRSS